jgi:tetratricopeptide (TPR) repeat protein
MANLARTIQVGFVTPVIIIIFFFFIAGHAAAQPRSAPTALVHYSFDDDLVDTGPDTFSVFQSGQGSVTLSTVYRFSGYRSVEIRDIPGDKDFPELQGYFPLRSKGKLYLHFAMMTTDAGEELNIALAGPQWFTLRKNGIAFWLKTAGGYLTAISDSMPKKLFAIRAFVWYIVDATYDIDAGAFDLTIHQEGLETPVADVRRQPNAASQPGSQVDKFSFIGDHDTDESKVVYYVDDVLVGVDEAIVHQPFVAPGRRKLFVDYWNSAQRAHASHPQPLPLMSLVDLGIHSTEAAALRRDGAGELLGQLLSGKLAKVPDDLPEPSRTLLQSVIAWRDGARALAAGDAELALARFDRAAQLSPSAPLFRMDAVMALTHLARWDEVDKRLAGIVPQWRDDPRLPATLAMIGVARGDLDAVERQMRADARSSGLMAEQYFLTLLWKGDSAGAEAFAESMLARGSDSDQALWREHAGDAAFLTGNIQRARDCYEASLAQHPRPSSVWLKLSDVYFKLGDLEKERVFRERVYGGLRER